MARRRKSSRARATSNTAVREAAFDPAGGGYVDADDYLYRALTGGRGDNLPEYKHERMLNVATYLARTNPVAKRILGLFSEFVLGEGVSLSYVNDQVETVLERHWNDPLNDWDRNGKQLFRSLLVTGELLLPLFPTTEGPIAGHMTVGCVPSTRIKEVRTDPENWRVTTEVVVKTPATQPDKVYTIVNTRDSAAQLLGVESPALFWSIGNDFGERGISVLYAVADFIDLLDQMAFSEVERWLLMKAFLWDITLTGSDDKQVEAYRKQHGGAPKPGSVHVHNEKVSIDAKNPALNTYDSANGMTWMRSHVLGGMGLPEHWYAEGGDVNRATATAMAEPTRKMLDDLQRDWRHILTDVFQTQTDYATLYGGLPAELPVQDSDGNDTTDMRPARACFTVDMPDLSPADTEQVVGTIATIATTLSVAEDAGYVSHPTAQRAFLTLLSQVGVEINVDEEVVRIKSEEAERERERQAELKAAQALRPPTPLAVLPARGERGDGQTREVGT